VQQEGYPACKMFCHNNSQMLTFDNQSNLQHLYKMGQFKQKLSVWVSYIIYILHTHRQIHRLFLICN